MESMDTSEDMAVTDTFPYRPARQRNWDLIHTALDLSFDWQKQDVIGSASLKLAPLFYPQSVLDIDADHFTVKSIYLFGKPYSDFKTEAEKISIRLPRPYKKGEEVTSPSITSLTLKLPMLIQVMLSRMTKVYSSSIL
jgi:aminopeptidase N